MQRANLGMGFLSMKIDPKWHPATTEKGQKQRAEVYWKGMSEVVAKFDAKAAAIYVRKLKESK